MSGNPWHRDNRIKDVAGELRDELKIDYCLDELLSANVLTIGEHSEVTAVLNSRGRIVANRTVIGHLLVGKSKNQIDNFVKIVAKHQPYLGYKIDSSGLVPCPARETHGVQRKCKSQIGCQGLSLSLSLSFLSLSL